jgi:light-regulated signal transduction histidine kinase (bacteriophytochrome)
MSADRSTPAGEELVRADDYAKAILNILDDFGAEKDRFGGTQKAILNILDDFGEEKTRLEGTQKAMLNLLDDFGDEKTRLEGTQKAMLNLLDDFDGEKSKVEAANAELRREIDERLETERELREKTDALARSNADLEQFAYVASHDLQEPLRMVSSYVQLFEKRYAGHVDAQADKYIRYAVEGAKRMQSLIGGLLEYSRVGRLDEPFGAVDTNAALDQALSNLRSAIEETHASITRGPLPTVTGNAGRIAQVFQNLIGNAIKFRHRDQTAKVHVSAIPQRGEWQFAIRDNGIGIDPQYLDRIFVIFQRLHTRAEYPGTGIGLSICKKVVERHGGRIWVESRVGAGATFHFTLPRGDR